VAKVVQLRETDAYLGHSLRHEAGPHGNSPREHWLEENIDCPHSHFPPIQIARFTPYYLFWPSFFLCFSFLRSGSPADCWLLTGLTSLPRLPTELKPDRTIFVPLSLTRFHTLHLKSPSRLTICYTAFFPFFLFRYGNIWNTVANFFYLIRYSLNFSLFFSPASSALPLTSPIHDPIVILKSYFQPNKSARHEGAKKSKNWRRVFPDNFVFWPFFL